MILFLLYRVIYEDVVGLIYTVSLDIKFIMVL